MRLILISGNIETSPGVVYPLGLARLAGAARAAGHDVAQYDLLVDGADRLPGAIGEAQPDMVCLSLRNIDYMDIRNPRSYVAGYRRLIAQVRECTRAPVVLGGGGFSIFPRALMKALDADCGVVGPGEDILVELIRSLSNGKSPIGLHGVQARGANGAEEESPRRQPCRVPCRSAHEPRLVEYYWREGGMIGLQTKCGCPGSCVYCTYPLVDGSRVIHADPGEVADEMERLHREWGVRYFFMVDSVFNLDESREMELAAEIRRRHLPVAWGAFFAPGRISRDYLETLIESGLTHIELGTDSLSDPVLKAMGKGFEARDVLEVAELCASLKVHCAHYLIFGGPGESPETIRKTMHTCRQIESCVFFPFVGVRVYPNTPLHQIAMEEGVVAKEDDLLAPRFYLAPGLEEQSVWRLIQEHVDGYRWVLPDQMHTILPILRKLRLQGRTGPLWEDLIG